MVKTSTQVTAAAFAIGLSLAGPGAVALADTGTTTKQTTSADQGGRASAARGHAPRAAANDTTTAGTRSASRTPAAAADTPAAPRSASRTTATPRSSARQASVPTAAETVGREPSRSTPTRTSASQQVPAETDVVAIAAETPAPLAASVATAATAPPTALAVASIPTAAVTAAATGDLFSGLLAPFQSFFEGIGLLIRRTFFNQAPTVTPLQSTGQLVGAITGTVGAVDPEGDPLTYAVTEAPRYGSVAVGADGSYAYTPGPDFTGLDSFNIAVTDAGFHLNLLDPSRPASTEAYLQVAQNATAPVLTFSFVYGSGSQYWSTEARNALQDSAALLATYLVVTSPTTIVYDVTGENAPASGTLASAGSDLSAPGTGFFATVVQKKIQTGADANGSAADGEITWNFGNSWAFGTTVDTSAYDFDSTAMHELLHTFGFLSYADQAGTNTGRSWTTFDQYLVTADGTRVITDSYRWNTAYNSALTGGLYFGGPNAVAAYGGVVPLYTPDPWESGSSVSHLDDDTFTGANSMLMNAATETGLGVRVLSPVELAILKDLGYTLTDSVPVQALFLLGFGFLRRRSGRDQRPVS